MQTFREITKQTRPNREIKRLNHIIAHHLGQLFPATITTGINRNIVQPLQEGVDHGRVVLRLGNEFQNRAAREVPPSGTVLLRTGCADDAGAFGHLPGPEASIQPGQDLPPGQIPGAAKDHQIEGIHRNNARNHVFS